VANASKKQSQPSNGLAWTKALPWIALAVAVAVIGYLLFKPASSGSVGGIRQVDSAGLMGAQKAGAQIVDVRTQGEYQLAHIPGSINVPVEQIQATAAGWNRDGYYVVYCASGARSAQAQQTMQSMGFKNVGDLSGGIANWTGATEKGASSSSQAVPTAGKPVFIEFYTPT
jgi:rhodanese-related sulfurtransferase